MPCFTSMAFWVVRAVASARRRASAPSIVKFASPSITDESAATTSSWRRSARHQRERLRKVLVLERVDELVHDDQRLAGREAVRVVAKRVEHEELLAARAVHAGELVAREREHGLHEVDVGREDAERRVAVAVAAHVLGRDHARELGAHRIRHLVARDPDQRDW